MHQHKYLELLLWLSRHNIIISLMIKVILKISIKHLNWRTIISPQIQTKFQNNTIEESAVNVTLWVVHYLSMTMWYIGLFLSNMSLLEFIFSNLCAYGGVNGIIDPTRGDNLNSWNIFHVDDAINHVKWNNKNI